MFGMDLGKVLDYGRVLLTTTIETVRISEKILADRSVKRDGRYDQGDVSMAEKRGAS